MSGRTSSGQVSRGESSVGRQFQATGEGTGGRLPPRSRTGCWTCRKRKVKCDEGRPICGPCMRLSQVCDYGNRITWRDVTAKTIETSGMELHGCPAWDVHAAGLPLRPPRPVDDLPEFTLLKNETERETKALWQKPGHFTVHTNQATFSSLPEYRDDPDETTPPDHDHRRRPATRRDSASPVRAPRAVGANAVLLERFESPSEKPPPTSDPFPRPQMQRLPDPYYHPGYQQQPPHQQSYSSYASLPHRPQPVDTTYHYQSGAYAPPPHPPQYPATYQYAQAGIPPPYPRHPPQSYTETSPVSYGSSPYTPTHPPHPPQYAYSPYQGSPYSEPHPPMVRPATVPRQAPALPQLPTYLPPAPSLYDTPVQPRHHPSHAHPHPHEPGQPIQPTLSSQQQHTPVGPAPGMGLEQYAMGSGSGYVAGRYGGHSYYEGEAEGQQ